MNSILDFLLHLDTHLFTMIVDYGPWVYALLFGFIFIETGFVVMPFLPGDSLLFAAGAFCAGVQNEAGETAQLSLGIIFVSLSAAAILGDSLNYYFGKTIGLRVLGWKIGGKQLVGQKNIEKNHEFFDKHGPKTIIIARFVPIIRTFAPFVAGIGDMHYKKFIRFNIIGGTVWVLLLTLVGYFFGNLPFVKNNFEVVVLGIIILSLVPITVEFIRNKFKK
ncbi:membrane-associated protein [Pricia antarctica]|uniref:Membrane-associated protein n=1 Tax=Pricia antarctica TaxID=641691 RepID=A0A1G7C262_9FLAO|nr:VTT domain-containing protein [Pricia antarctica]SDE33369.1 membrane-associated protein [Pricia antarctica]